MEVKGSHEEERRVAARRSNNERRFGERRQPERATVGRRVQFVPDRRMEFRRSFDHPAPELA